jgi:SAM-dependent methyltransferase
MKRLTHVPNWTGIDPALPEETVTDRGCTLRPARASRLEFPDGTFDVAVFANVFEHIPPAERDVSLDEIYRVLKPGGIVVGQLPNPYFPIESHSRLPFMGWLPTRWQRRYWKLAPVSWARLLRRHDQAPQADGATRRLRRRHVRNFNYPSDALPSSVRWAARLLEQPMRYMPWSWQFVLVRPA